MKNGISNVKILRFHFAKRDFVPPIVPMSLSCVDITFCIEGQMHYFLDGEEIVLSASDAIIMPSGSVRERLFSDGYNYYASLNLLVPKDLVPMTKGLVQKVVDAEILYILRCMWTCYTTSTSRSEEKCIALTCYLYNRLLEAIEGEGNPYVRKIKQLVLDNPSARYTLTELSNYVHLTPEYLCHVFKKHTGVTLMEYITSKRIDYAKKLILTHDIKLSDVAERSGFSDYYAFSHAFKKLEGICAAKYKKSKCNLIKN